MELALIKTEYNFDCLGNAVHATVSHQNEKMEIDLFINSCLAYYRIFEKIEIGSTDETELAKHIIEIMKNDKARWIRDCSLLLDHVSDLNFVNKISIYEAVLNEYVFRLKLTTSKNADNQRVFKLEYSNNVNSDVLDGFVEADSLGDLLRKCLLYADTIMQISNIFVKNNGMLSNGTFLGHFS